jgi:hypothetical protein
MHAMPERMVMTRMESISGGWVAVVSSALLLTGITGCAMRPTHNAATQKLTSEPAQPSISQKITDIAKSPWTKLKQSVHPEKIPEGWQWVSAIPSGLPRAELIPPALPSDSLSYFAPRLQTPVRRVSTGTATQSYLVERIDDDSVKDLASLTMALEEASTSRAAVVHLREASADSAAPSIPIPMDPRKLLVMAQVSGADHQIVRMTHGGRPSALIRQGPVRCVVTPRLERERGLLQLILTERVCWGERRVLPLEVTVTCDGTPLRCLTMSETLELLYGDFDASLRSGRAEQQSFAAVSEREDYLIPSNYRRLSKRVEEARGGSYAKRPQPALIELQEVEYPGPAVLGDARALGAFLLQRQFLQPDDPEDVGWILFAGKALRNASQIEIQIDLGQGAVPLEFVLPDINTPQ